MIHVDGGHLLFLNKQNLCMLVTGMLCDRNKRKKKIPPQFTKNV